MMFPAGSVIFLSLNLSKMSVSNASSTTYFPLQQWQQQKNLIPLCQGPGDNLSMWADWQPFVSHGLVAEKERGQGGGQRRKKKSL